MSWQGQAGNSPRYIPILATPSCPCIVLATSTCQKCCLECLLHDSDEGNQGFSLKAFVSQKEEGAVSKGLALVKGMAIMQVWCLMILLSLVLNINKARKL